MDSPNARVTGRSGPFQQQPGNVGNFASLVHVIDAEANLVARLHCRIGTDKSSNRERIERINVANSAVRVSSRFCQSPAERITDSNHSCAEAAPASQGCDSLDSCLNLLIRVEPRNQPTKV